MKKTTIQLNVNTLERLKTLKNFERQSYDELLINMINNIQDEILTKEEIDDIKIALENVKRGEVKPIEQVAQELGIQLA